MENELIISLEIEIREEFHIPPYFENISNFIKEANSHLSLLVNEIDYDQDLEARSLLKNYVNYAYNNRVNDFDHDYAFQILTWQFSKIDSVGDE